MDAIAPNIVGTSISVVIASKGRPDLVSETIESLQGQTLKPEQIIIVLPSIEDLPAKKWRDHVQYIVGPNGSSSQRNRGIEAIPSAVPYVACFDDAFELKEDYLEQAVAFLAGGGITREEAKKLIASYRPREDPRGIFFSQGKHHILFGCKMIIRRALLNYETFDENLPLYSYGEDYDLSIRLERYGRVGRFMVASGFILKRRQPVCVKYYADTRSWRTTGIFLHKGVIHLPLFMAWTRLYWTKLSPKLRKCAK
jgi:glycosyltransferase involved in cell wall biosynthesis